MKRKTWSSSPSRTAIAPTDRRRGRVAGKPIRVSAKGACGCLIAAVCVVLFASQPVRAITMVPVLKTLEATGARDQDDMGVWIHPTDRTRSTIIGADKGSEQIYVYDLRGAVLQTLKDVGDVGGIDVRYGFPLGGEPVDVVVFNDRDPSPYRLRIFKVDPVTRTLASIDDGSIVTGTSYGSCLYRSTASGNLYAFTTAKDAGVCEQWQLDGSSGTVRGKKVRTLPIGSQSEGCVADDERGRLYIAEEAKGVWVYGAEPDDSAARTAVDDAGRLAPDVEGVTIYRGADGSGYLIVSSQGADRFDVFDRVAEIGSPHRFRGTFKLTGIGRTDGIDVASVDLGGPFSSGLFVAHNGRRPSALAMVPWADIARALDLSTPAAVR